MIQKELFIVEGQSAEHALLRALDNKHQSVHALQGKLANVRDLSDKAVAANLECQNLMAILFGGFEQANQIDFSNVLILMDPDIDGTHSSALLLSFLVRFCEPIISARKLSIIKAPMFRVCIEETEPLYAWSEEELQRIVDGCSDNQSASTTRFKGIAQFSIQECHQLLLNPNTRRQYVLR